MKQVLKDAIARFVMEIVNHEYIYREENHMIGNVRTHNPNTSFIVQ